ncbi:type 11 methyltransferase [Nitzschia inconspicua]|uniref:Type 11 methyltransferase n=1 Tax=Nitzschia inconspicua TaxID=303405 RepID=A0A9K3L4V3_9STRA|nr:type 11 methyltransferase [Nitzschia inconspicua]
MKADTVKRSSVAIRSFSILLSHILALTSITYMIRPWRVAAYTILKANHRPSCNTKIVTSSNTNDSMAINRAKFLSASAATFFTSTSSVFVVMANNPEECQAKPSLAGNNPRYIERELEMAYGTDGNGNPRTRGVLVRRLTGDSTPYSFPVSPIRLVKEWPETPPFRPEDFSRSDSNDDGWFYKVPRLVYHIDEPAVASLTQYYRNNIAPKSDILDICSSWVSHYPLEFPETMGKICATGMSSLELQFNDQLTGGYEQRDLNVDPKLPYPDSSFDVVTCVVSIDYLIEPIQVLKEVHRVLRPGGKVIVSQSNRCFPSKAIAMWLQMNDRQHLELINGYFQYAGGFEPRNAFDITATVPGNEPHDPMFVIEAVKSKSV